MISARFHLKTKRFFEMHCFKAKNKNLQGDSKKIIPKLE